MVQYGTWIPYSGTDSFILAAVLLVVSGLFGYLGIRLPHPLEPRRPGLFIGASLVLIWLLALVAFGDSAVTYFQALVRLVGNFTPPPSPTAPVTAASGLIGFVAIVYLARRSGWKLALVSAVVGMLAAPMIFELPFDLIVMSRLYPTPPEPVAQYTLLYFLPLFIVAVSSFTLLTLSPLTRLSRFALFSLAAMFLVFSGWALFGFSYPSAPIPLAFNVVGKILSFVTAVALFLP